MKRRPQRGAALLAAMLTVTLVATFAAASLWQQWRSVEIEAADRTRVKAEWIITGALDWARLILREDRNTTDHLGEPWAVPLQEARLGTFLAADQSNNMDLGDADNVFLSGDITDLQSRLNLLNLVQAGNVQDDWLEVFRRLFEVLGLPQSQLGRMKENLRFAADISVDNLNAARAPLLPQRVEQLVWLGLSADVVAALQPFVTVLPPAPGGQSLPLVNVNTASAEVLYAAIPGIGLADAQRLVAERERQHFTGVDKALALLPEDVRNPGATGAAKSPGRHLTVLSTFFELRGRLRMDQVVIEERSIVHRPRSGQVRTLHRERAAPSVPAATSAESGRR